jgi:hypothetical protein
VWVSEPVKIVAKLMAVASVRHSLRYDWRQLRQSTENFMIKYLPVTSLCAAALPQPVLRSRRWAARRTKIARIGREMRPTLRSNTPRYAR